MNTMTLEDARAELVANEHAGTTCPCCYQHYQVYHRRLSPIMAYGLYLIDKHFSAPDAGEWLHLENYFKNLPVPSTLRGDVPKLKYWRLIEPKVGVRADGSPSTGLYHITALGKAFVRGNATVAEKILVCNKTLRGYEGPQVSFRQCMESKRGFNYAELMRGGQ
jgi:hypothetical protein